MGKLKKTETDLGLTFEGSASEGHTINETRATALGEVFKTDDRVQSEALLTHCLKVLGKMEAGDGGDANDERGFMLTIIRDLEPRDAVERMLAVQMAATHVATIRCARMLAHADRLPQAQAHYIGFNKLARTFTAQIEALRKHRTGGKQTVTVQHVNVSDGGQAIVGNVKAGGGARDER
jgi:hypothetical protein